ncbi:MAG TPA: 3-phosphoshikimate 1-carboxyvinyltransferase [Geminicoccaceae bacterium]|nr:3-phosphoshikimate 1-carboxyvinyltransferase [Geminicoccaceae bacterium]
MELRAHPGGPLTGDAVVPGDKSLSHRALMFAAMAAGPSRIEGLLEGDDVRATARALAACGVELHRDGPGRWLVHGVGLGGLAEPDDVLDLGNSGTAARLLLGILAGHPATAFVTGDRSLRARPMARVIAPLARMGARFRTRSGDRLPLAVTGGAELLPIVHESEVASAQVKSAVLLAGLHAAGRTTVIEPRPSRDHTERLLGHMGADILVEDRPDGRRRVTVIGRPELAPADVVVPGDPSSAAFPAVAALLAGGGSRVRLRGVGANPLRTGLYATLAEMGADVAFGPTLGVVGEPVADLTAQGARSRLSGVEVPPERAPTMIDEYPILAVAAACARGVTVMRGLAELRVKESDRLAAMAEGLAACGVRVEAGADSLTVYGCDGPPEGGAVVDARLDHRIAMSFLVLGTVARRPVTVAGAETIETSFPGFAALMNRLGARIEPPEAPPAEGAVA